MKILVNMDSISKIVAFLYGRVKFELKPQPEGSLDTIVSIDRSGTFKKWLSELLFTIIMFCDYNPQIDSNSQVIDNLIF